MDGWLATRASHIFTLHQASYPASTSSRAHRLHTNPLPYASHRSETPPPPNATPHTNDLNRKAPCGHITAISQPGHSPSHTYITARSQPIRRQQLTTPSSLTPSVSFAGLIIQLPRRPPQNARDFLHLFPCKRPVSIVDGVADAREVSGLVAGPGLRGEDDVLVLGAVGELCGWWMLVDVTVRQVGQTVQRLSPLLKEWRASV